MKPKERDEYMLVAVSGNKILKNGSVVPYRGVGVRRFTESPALESQEQGRGRVRVNIYSTVIEHTAEQLLEHFHIQVPCLLQRKTMETDQVAEHVVFESVPRKVRFVVVTKGKDVDFLDKMPTPADQPPLKKATNATKKPLKKPSARKGGGRNSSTSKSAVGRGRKKSKA